MADKYKADAIKKVKNPLLTAAGIGFPFENFPSSAYLVPVTQNEGSLHPEDIEADSFIGQDLGDSDVGTLSYGSITPTQQPLISVSQSHFSNTIASKTEQNIVSNTSSNIFSPFTLNSPELPNFTSSLRTSHVPENPVPIFSQKFLPTNNLVTRPTPVYCSQQPDSLGDTFSQSLSLYDSHVTQAISSQAAVPEFYQRTPSVQRYTPENIVTHSASEGSVSTTEASAFSVAFNSNSVKTAEDRSAVQPGVFTENQKSTTASNLLPNYNTDCQHPEGISSNVSPVPVNQLPASSYSGGSIDIKPSVLPPPPPPPSSAARNTGAVGAHGNTYRLQSLKRPVYSRPPELGVTSHILPKLTTMPGPVAQSDGVTDIYTPSEPVDTRADERLPLVATIAPSNSHSASPPTLPLSYQSSVNSQSPPPALVTPTLFSTQGVTYREVYHHWFFRRQIEGKVLWTPFSMSDSLALEEAFTSSSISPDTKVATDGGRYDVEILRRRRIAVYWEEEPNEVRRCSWFVKGSLDSRYVPYEENIATLLEEEYKIAMTTNEWNRQVNLPSGDGEVIILHGPNAIAHHMRSSSPDAWGNIPQVQQKPRVVKRGLDEFDISEGEPEKIDHLLFLVHGVGQYCDMRFRPVIEVVDDFRSISLQLLQSHFKGATEEGLANRMEVLPVSWHKALHNEDMDKKLNNITLKSIPRLRHFTNDTLLDILFYTSPVFCETIVQAVGSEINRLYTLFLSRNPQFEGSVSLGGHSLGSLILFDMLCNQSSLPTPTPSTDHLHTVHHTEPQDMTQEKEMKSLGCMKTQKARLSRGLSYLTIGTGGTGQPYISYPQLIFKPKAFFALGSPIGMFVTVRGIDFLGEDFVLPTCPSFFNIFHPFDPVAYRIEPLLVKGFSKYPPVLIPHHKGRKRMHLELRDTLEHVGAALKQRLLDSVRNTWNTVYQLAMFHRTDGRQAIEEEVTKVIEDEINRQPASGSVEGLGEAGPGENVTIGSLNGGRRVDYVLQEAPLESFNEYIFAMSSHVCYWESEDTLLMILKEVYHSVGVTPDSQVPQQILPFDTGDSGSSTNVYNPAPSTPNFVSLTPSDHVMGMDPTAPISENLSMGPPPLSGFVRK